MGQLGRSATIAVASILAKVTRDRIMVDYHATYPIYGFDSHKGYGAAVHMAAINSHGPCPIHRRSFAQVAKQRQMMRLATFYMARYQLSDVPCRFDVVEVIALPEQPPQFTLLQNAFDATGMFR